LAALPNVQERQFSIVQIQPQQTIDQFFLDLIFGSLEQAIKCFWVKKQSSVLMKCFIAFDDGKSHKVGSG